MTLTKLIELQRMIRDRPDAPQIIWAAFGKTMYDINFAALDAKIKRYLDRLEVGML